jgi:alpha-glucosidase (family GH31 glycosyl hydrolase)
MVFDEYLNWISTKVFTETDDKFTGIFGLGERVNKDFFFKDGVYSMWARDQPNTDETGKSPGNNMYGTHPFYMYKHKTNTWIGVLTKLAHAQDWWIKNNSTLGTVDVSTIATGGVADIYLMIGSKPDEVVSKFFTLVGKPVMIP